MLIGAKSDDERRRKVTTEDGQAVSCYLFISQATKGFKSAINAQGSDSQYVGIR